MSEQQGSSSSSDQQIVATAQDLVKTLDEIENDLNHRRGIGPQHDVRQAWGQLRCKVAPSSTTTATTTTTTTSTSASSSSSSDAGKNKTSRPDAAIGDGAGGDNDNEIVSANVVTTILDAYETENARFLTIARQESINLTMHAYHTVNDFVLLGGSKTVDAIPLKLFQPMTYKTTFRCTDRAIRYLLKNNQEEEKGDVEKRLESIKNPDDLERMLLDAAKRNKDMLVILSLKSIGNMRTTSVGLVIDCLPALVGAPDNGSDDRQQARKIGFVRALGEHACKVVETSRVANEVLCFMLILNAVETRREHRKNCLKCFPANKKKKATTTSHDDDDEEDNIVDFLSNLDFTTKYKCGNNKMERIVHIDLFFPQCLPQSWKERSALDSFEWLKDIDLRRECVRETLAGHTRDGKHASPIGASLPYKVQGRGQVLDCGGFRKGGEEAVEVMRIYDKMKNDEFIVAVHTGVHPDGEEDVSTTKTTSVAAGTTGEGGKGGNDDAASGYEGFLQVRTYKFRRPAVRVVPADLEGGSNDDSAAAAAADAAGDSSLSHVANKVVLDRKKCEHCGKDEAVTRTYANCAACKMVRAL